jgi:hypothetical protein
MYIINEEIRDADQNQNNVRKLAAIVFRNLVLKDINVSDRNLRLICDVIVRRKYRHLKQPLAKE